MKQKNRFTNWKYPEIIDGELTKYNWVVQNKSNFRLGHGVDIGAFTYINAQFGVNIKDNVQIPQNVNISLSNIDLVIQEVLKKQSARIYA